MAITVVQSTTGTGVLSGSTGTISFTSNVTAGNCVVVCVGEYPSNMTITGVTIGGSADNFSQAAYAVYTPTSVVNAIWVDPGAAGGSKNVVVTWSSSGTDADFVATIYEISGLATANVVDKTSTGNNSSGSWSSGTTATTTQPNEIWIGSGSFISTTPTAPSSPWTNTTNTGAPYLLAGYQIVSTTGTATYNQTTSPSSGWAACVVTLIGASQPAAPTPVQPGGQVWRNQFRRPQVLPNPVPVVTATGNYAVAPVMYSGQELQAQPARGNVQQPGGQTWQRQFRRRQVAPLPPPPTTGGFSLAPVNFGGTVNVQIKPFPQYVLPLKVEILINGTWTDITDFVYERDGVSITRGLPDETQAVTPSSMTLTLNNRDGRFSPKNPGGAYSPYLTRNVQLRASVVYAASGTGVFYNGYRFWGEVSSWPPRWDSTGTDVYCQIIVSGVLRRYVQGANIGSPMKRYYSGLTGNFAPYAYWPGEDGSKATEIASALPSVASMTFTGKPGFASDSAFGGSDALPTISSSEWHGVTSAASTPPGSGSITETFPGTYTWTCPNGVTAVTSVDCIGSGGGGGDGVASGSGGGGGGGGEQSQESSIAVTAGTTYTYVVPAGGAAGATSNGSDGSSATFTGDSVTCTGHGGHGGVYGGSGGAGGTGSSNSTHHNGGAGASGSSSTTSFQSDSLYGYSGSSGGGGDGGQQSVGWTAPAGITGSVSISAQGAGGGGQGGGAFSAGYGGGGGGGGGYNSGSTTVSAGNSLTFYAGNGGNGGSSGSHGGNGGNSTVSDGSVTAYGGGDGNGAGAGGAGGSGSPSGGNGGNGHVAVTGHGMGGGGGGGDSGYDGGSAGQSAPGPSNNPRQPGGGSGAGSGGGWGAVSNGGSNSTSGSPANGYGGGGSGGGAITNTTGQVGGGGGAGWIEWSWEVTGAPAGGGGGSSAGTSAAGNAGSTTGTGGSAPTGGGAGGTAGATPAGVSPGGGGAGGVPAFGSSSALTPGAGAAGQVSFAWNGGATSPVAADIVRFCLQVNSTGAADGAVLLRAVTYGTITTLDVIYNTANGGEITLKGYTGGTPYFTSAAITAVNGLALYVDVELTASGANANYTFAAIVPGAGSAYATETGSVSTVSIGNVSDVYVDPAGAVTDSGTTIGQITCQTYADTLVNLSPIVNGHAGEYAADRLARLCAEEGIAFTLVGTNTDTPLMGPQQDDKFVSVLQSCADLDRGQLYETRDSFGIGYRTRVNLQGQSPAFLADYSLATLAGSLQPTADDQYTRNDITVTRNGGSSATAALSSGAMSTAIPPNGVGDYTYALTVYANADSQLANLVAWMLTVGTVDEYRYPSITFDLARPEVASLFAAIASLDIGGYVQVINPPSFLQSQPISQLAWGFTEKLSNYEWTISINTVPESPYSQGNPPTW